MWQTDPCDCDDRNDNEDPHMAEQRADDERRRYWAIQRDLDTMRSAFQRVGEAARSRLVRAA